MGLRFFPDPDLGNAWTKSGSSATILPWRAIRDVDPDQYRSAAHLLEEACANMPPALLGVHGTLDELTVSWTAAQSPPSAPWLQARAGARPATRVAIMLPNIPQFAVTMAAVLRAGTPA